MTRLTAQQIENLPEWMTIPDFPNYDVNCRAGLVRNSRTLRVRKPSLDKYGYPYVRLHKDGKQLNKTLHRLVALTAFGFYNISTDGLLVMHLDEERNDTRISNLTLGTNKENLNFPKAKLRLSESRRGEKNPNFGKHRSAEFKKKMSKRVGAYKDGVLTLIFNSLTKVNVYGFNMCAVRGCCKGRRKQHKGYQWRYF